MIGRLRIAVAAALVLAAGNAWALGLGQIQVKSGRNQPLLAEIPIVSTTPGELQALQARLASPDTFRRVGLAPPSGVASDLQFSLGSDARGRPVIRVTTVRPVDQPVLNFLIEVDWGQGRLVREYSALIDVPQTASAAVPTAIDMPATPAPAVVQRPVALPPPAPEPTPDPAPLPQRPAAPPPVAAAPAEPTPAARSPSIAPVAAPPAPQPAVVARESPSEYGPVKRGESLSAIASQLEIRQATSLEQTMLALLRANPDAFLDDDINRLRRGAVLRVPSHAEVAAIDADEAGQVVRQQMQQWRRARRAVRQPDADVPQLAAAPARAPAAAAAPSAPSAAAAPAVRPVAPTVAAPRRSDARLEIVPAAAPGKANGTRSGTAAGGEGSMQQQIRQRDEDIAAKAAEIDELKERVAALEKLKDEQQSLISLKDSELAAAQQRLAEVRTAAPPVTSPAIAQQATRQSAEAPQVSTPPVWWIALGVVAAALLAWLLVGRRNRKATTPRVRRLFDSEALATSMVPVAPEAVPDDAEVAVVSADAVVAEADAEAHSMPQAVAEPIADADADAAPTWHSATRVASVADADDLPETTPPAGPAPLAAALAGVAAPTSASQRFKLVRAFLDIGDDDSARQLLHELLGDADAGVRTDATRMLRELG